MFKKTTTTTYKTQLGNLIDYHNHLASLYYDYSDLLKSDGITGLDRARLNMMLHNIMIEGKEVYAELCSMGVDLAA